MDQSGEMACCANGTPVFESIEQVSSGWINKYLLTYRLPNGQSYVYESASRKDRDAYEAELRSAGAPDSAGAASDAISIVGRTSRDEILLIREFRYPLNSWCIAFPAGLVEPGEELATCADRELREETGYRVVSPEDGSPAVRLLPQPGCSSTGMTDESVQVCFARVEALDEPNPEPNEFIEPFTVPLSHMRAFLDGNKLPIGTRCQLVLEAYAHLYPQDAEGRYF